MSRMIFALSLLPTVANAAVLTAPSDDYPTIQSAIDAAVTGDQIEILSGTYDVELTVPISLTLRAAPEAVVFLANTTGTSGQVIDVLDTASTFVIQDIGFLPSAGNRAIRTTGVGLIDIDRVQASGLSVAGDGAFLLAVEPNSVSLDDVEVIGVTAANGGAVYVQREASQTNAPLRIRTSTFETGVATGDGGLIWAENVDLTVSDTTLNDGYATHGGAVYVRNADRLRLANLSNLFVSGNVATELGGGVYIEGYRVNLNNASFTQNVAGSGGGMWTQRVESVPNVILNALNGTAFIDNTALGLGTSVQAMAGTGAALHADMATLEVNGLTLSDNSGLEGALWFAGDVGRVRNSTFHGNLASGDGAAVRAGAATSFSLEDSDVAGNTAGGHGGALHVSTPTAAILRTDLVTNTADGDGGAAWLSTGPLNVDRSLFADNAAAAGGALYREPNVPFTEEGEDPIELDHAVAFTQSDFFRNQADSAGAVHLDGVGATTLTRNTWCENTAAPGGVGGGLRVVGATGALRIRNDGAAANLATSGGVYAVDGYTSLVAEHVTFFGNTADDGSALLAAGVDEATLTRLAVVSHQGPLFSGPAIGTLTVEHLGITDNVGGILGGGWSTQPTPGVTELADTFLFNNAPAACEDLRLYPHARNASLRGGEVGDTGSLHFGLSGGVNADPTLRLDGDGDGVARINDCADDDDPTRNPDAPDICDGIDNDCDGEIDEDPDTIWYQDNDGDTFGAPDLLPFGATVDDPEPVRTCEAPEGAWSDNALDCDDTDDAINPAAIEVCDGIDNNCSGAIDDDAIDALVFFRDADLDGFGTDSQTIEACEAPIGYTDVVGDCDDQLANVFPGATERCDTLDTNCDGEVDNDAIDAVPWYPDADKDGYGVTDQQVIQCLPPLNHSNLPGDCDDNDPTRNPGAPEVCDGIDNNCSGDIDVDPISPRYFPDTDGDGYGDASAASIGSCTPLEGLITNGTDCDDTDPETYPGAPEACNGLDNDCDGEPDNNPTNGNLYYLDADSDGFGNDAFEIFACSLPLQASEVAGDCNDNNATMFPGNDEFCDGVDNDCDGDIDEPDAVDVITWYADVDGDNYGDSSRPRLSCNPPIGHVPVGDDCDDNNPQAFPSAIEVCDGIDNDCDGEIDNNAVDAQFYYADADGDGFGDPDTETLACFPPSGFVSDNSDCDDTDPAINPAAIEILGNGIDDNCDGQSVPGPPEPEEPEEQGCGGCSSSSNPAAPLFGLPLLGALLYRRRRA